MSIIWNMAIQCDHHIEARRPGILVVEKDSKKSLTIAITSSGDHKVVEKGK